MLTGSADPFFLWSPGAPPGGFACYPGASAASRRRRGEVAACYLARGAPPLLLPGRARPATGVPHFRAGARVTRAAGGVLLGVRRGRMSAQRIVYELRETAVEYSIV